MLVTVRSPVRQEPQRHGLRIRQIRSGRSAADFPTTRSSTWRSVNARTCQRGRPGTTSWFAEFCRAQYRRWGQLRRTRASRKCRQQLPQSPSRGISSCMPQGWSIWKRRHEAPLATSPATSTGRMLHRARLRSSSDCPRVCVMALRKCDKTCDQSAQRPLPRPLGAHRSQIRATLTASPYFRLVIASTTATMMTPITAPMNRDCRAARRARAACAPTLAGSFWFACCPVARAYAAEVRQRARRRGSGSAVSGQSTPAQQDGRQRAPAPDLTLGQGETAATRQG